MDQTCFALIGAEQPRSARRSLHRAGTLSRGGEVLQPPQYIPQHCHTPYSSSIAHRVRFGNRKNCRSGSSTLLNGAHTGVFSASPRAKIVVNLAFYYISTLYKLSHTLTVDRCGPVRTAWLQRMRVIYTPIQYGAVMHRNTVC